ncbi:uncharacterized protein LOC109609329 [Aethina tumida]|uniref:uncharacterized protein LOC109609329 n=1 Tax=Aethina tumida TaxID=116153 RepID=UPI0021493324|nr:uncharacterized protein LOC109609329 [Aethina tumida]
MSLFRFPWLRRFVRRNTNPIPQDKAYLWKNRLSLAYMLICWNAFGLVCYMFYQGKGDWAKYYGLKSEEELKMTPAQKWTKTLGIRDATVYSVKGLNVEKYNIHNDDEDFEKK